MPDMLLVRRPSMTRSPAVTPWAVRADGIDPIRSPHLSGSATSDAFLLWSSVFPRRGEGYMSCWTSSGGFGHGQVDKTGGFGQKELLCLTSFSQLRDGPLLETKSSGRVAVLPLTLAFHGVKNRENKETSHKRKEQKFPTRMRKETTF